MCGICGIAGPLALDRIALMTDSLAHRGPDGSGTEYFPDQKLSFGHRRLSIIDLSTRGRQPMTNEDRNLWITFNGEIYNYKELRAGLDASRHQFQSNTDTEVILHLYEERGVSAFSLLDGMYAFALYDAKKARLFLVRDHFGVKPLYYAQTDRHFIFGSEIKSLLAAKCHLPVLDEQSLHDYFSFLYVPCPHTIYQGIFQVPPAHWLEYNLEGKRIVKTHCYWELQHGGEAETPSALPEELRHVFGEAVRQQMVSDVPLGAFLSGGIDSNLIVGLMAQAAPAQPIKTFTVLFEGENLSYYDERVEAKRVADRFHTEHHELAIDLSHPEKMLELIEHFDQPFGNTTFYLTYLLAQHTRKHVTVALSGVGGDELFGGYPRYRAVNAAGWLRAMPQWLIRLFRASLSYGTDSFSDRRLHRWRTFFEGANRDEAQQYLQWVYYLNEPQKERLLLHTVRDKKLPSHRFLRQRLDRYPKSWDRGSQFSRLDLETFLPDNLLEYSDKMTMAHGLELRVPFLDRRIVELAFRIPFSLKLNRHGSKQILRQAFSDLIPSENLKVPKKGFNVPLGNWMKTKLDRYFDELLPESYVKREGIFNYEAIVQMRAEHQRGKKDNSYELFSILMFDAWYRKYITNNW